MYGLPPFLHIWEKESVEDNNAIKAIEKETLKKKKKTRPLSKKFNFL